MPRKSSQSKYTLAPQIDHQESAAFIADGKHHGYSKALRKPGLGNTWDENMFQNIFGT